MTEHVGAIRLVAGKDPEPELHSLVYGYAREGSASWNDVLTWINALIAQAEREREEERHLRVQLSEDSQRHLDQLIAARAEVERLKEVEAVLRPGATNYNRERIRADQAEADLARVRAIVDGNRKQNILGQFICDDCGKEWPNHDLEFCLVGQIGAALEGRG